MKKLNVCWPSIIAIVVAVTITTIHNDNIKKLNKSIDFGVDKCNISEFIKPKTDNFYDDNIDKLYEIDEKNDKEIKKTR